MGSQAWRFHFGFLESENELLDLVLIGGIVLAVAALLWPAPTFRVTQLRTRLDDVMPEYQFDEMALGCPCQAGTGDESDSPVDVRRHEIPGHAAGNSRSSLRHPDTGDFFRDKRVLDAFSESGYVSGGDEHEILTCGGANVRAGHVLSLAVCRSTRNIASLVR